MQFSASNNILPESIPLYKKITDYELLLNQLIYKIDKSTLNLDPITDKNTSNDYTLLEKLKELDSEITDKFPYKRYDEINKAYEDIKTDLDSTDTELKDKILMTLYSSYKRLNAVHPSTSKSSLLKNIPINTVINYSQRLSKFTSKPQVTMIDQSIIGDEMTPQPQDPSGWNFIWAGDDMIRRGNLVVQQQQAEIMQQKIKSEYEAQQLEEQRQKEYAAKAVTSQVADAGLMFDGKHKEKTLSPAQQGGVEKAAKEEEEDEDFDLDLFNPDEF